MPDRYHQLSLRSALALTASMAAAAIAPHALADAGDAEDGRGRPNILIILADDMGYSDIGSYGGEIQTPVLDDLARGGLRFTQFYNTARCSPTRASLLTGVYPHQAGMGHLADSSGDHPGYAGELSDEAVTIAEVLGRAGYATFMTGKWHLTANLEPDGPDKANWPRQRGFDRFYGTLRGAGSFFDPATLTRGNTMISPFDDPGYDPDGTFYYTDAINHNVSRFIQEHRKHNEDQPFFLYVAHPAPHWPMHARPEDIEKYEGAYDEGYHAIREARYRRMIEMDLIDSQWELSTTVGEWDGGPGENWDLRNMDWESDPHRDWEVRNMEVYAAMIDCMDQGIGEIIQTLEQTGDLDNTLILFLSDNGASPEPLWRRGEMTRPEEPTEEPVPDERVRTQMRPDRTRNGYPVLHGPNIKAGPADTYIAYGVNWANVSNTPFRAYKHFSHEGGIATPLIAHWPGGIPGERAGDMIREPAHLIDILATILDITDAEYPRRYGGRDIRPLEGVSLLPLLKDDTFDRKNPIFFEHEGTRAVRDGRWKLVASNPFYPPYGPTLSGERGDADYTRWKLFDMETDRTELNDLSAEHPDRRQRMIEQWEEWAGRANVLPLGAYRTRRNQFSDRTHFELEPGANLANTEAPFLEDTPLTVTAEIARAGEGVILAHGGAVHGYALYVDEGRLHLAWNHIGRHFHFPVDRALPDGSFTLTFEYDEQGVLTIDIDGERALETRVIAPWERSMPGAGLQVGEDQAPTVGEYGAPNQFDGQIGGITIERHE